MDDLIERARAIEIIHELQDSKTFDQTADMAYDLVDWAISEIPSVQPETHEERTETHACDLISRQLAIDALTRFITPHDNGDGTMTVGVLSKSSITDILNDLPSAQPKHDISKANFLCPICGAEMEVAVSEWEGEG